ncbi:UNVERIFIED_CONTAM: hypothetical protein K2H54_002019, partial [Gekko kuhli]
IRQLQLILLKVALILGVQIHNKVQFKGLIPPTAMSDGQVGGWRAVLHPCFSPLSQYKFDVLISAGGGRFVPEGFKRKETRGKLAIGITANFVNHHSRAEVEVAEISGVARIYNQQFFQNLYNKTGIDLENIVYYKDDTHYFVMTAKKQSLLKKGVILNDMLDIESLLSPDNVNQEALLAYAKEAADFSTSYQLPNLQFALNHHNQPDVDMFDFTCMSRSENAALVRDCHGTKLLIGLVGDCLVEPFWPLGTGVGRGFLAAFDAAWMVKRWASGTPPLDVLAERIFLAILQLDSRSPESCVTVTQRSGDTGKENAGELTDSPPVTEAGERDSTNKNISRYSIDPTTRYPNINLQAIKASQDHCSQLWYEVWSIVQTEKMRDLDQGIQLLDASCGYKYEDSNRAYEELLSWCQTNTANYPDIKVVDFTHSWKSGLALCALIHHFRPDLLDFNSLVQNDPIGNNQIALDVAEQELGIPPVLSSTEMASMSETDRLGLITYLSQFYDAFKSSPEVEEEAAKPLSPRGTKGAILFLSKLQKSLSLSRKRTLDSNMVESQTKRTKQEAGSPPLSPGRSSDACYFCGEHVYIVERVSAEGRFFHRGCFKCHHCKTTLRLGDYVLNEDDGNFYCMLHCAAPTSMAVPDRRVIMKAACKDSTQLYIPSDKGIMDFAAEETRIETDAYRQSLDENLSSFTDHLPAEQPAELQILSQEDANLFPSRENGAASTTNSSQFPPHQHSAVRDDELGSPVSEDHLISQLVNKDTKEGRAHPKNLGHGLRNWTYSLSQEEALGNLEIGMQGAQVEPPHPRDDPKLEKEESEDFQRRRRICLSTQEKLELSRLSPISASFNFPNMNEICTEDSSFRKDSDSLEIDSDSEEEPVEDEEEESQDLCAKTCSLSVIEEEKHATWKNTLMRRAKEAEMKRFCKAQSIQRRLEEIEVTFRELEKQGIKLERSLREEGGTESELKKLWMNQLLSLVQKKNSLMSEESDLMIVVQELKLEERQSQLDQELRQYYNMEESLKTPEDQLAEKKILSQLLEVVNQRSALIEMQENKRLSELSEEVPKM